MKQVRGGTRRLCERRFIQLAGIVTDAQQLPEGKSVRGDNVGAACTWQCHTTALNPHDP